MFIMEIKLDEEFLKICESIVSEAKNGEEWAEIESDDMFQTEKYEGGYDATEEAFCFSYYDENKKEYWFQLTLKEIQQVLRRKIEKVEAIPAL